MDVCQACRKRPVEVVDDRDNPEFPYRVCHECHHRLVNMALRPLEWFNLTAMHGMPHLLNDDFYSDDGEAGQPRIEVEGDAALSFPILSEIRDLRTLVDYAIVKWWLSREIIDAFEQFEKQLILRELDERININRGLAKRIYDLAAETLGGFAEAWVLNQWEFRSSDKLLDYAEAMAKCLPVSGGFNLYAEEIVKAEQPSKLVWDMVGLIYFQSTLGLEWIEKNIHRVTNIKGSWGTVAAASKISWPVVQKWLNTGRPLSLVALDALMACAATSDSRNVLPWLWENPQKLLAPETIDEMNRVLSNYYSIDRVPRVKSSVNYIKANWDAILKIPDSQEFLKH